MQIFEKKYIYLGILILAGWMLNGCQGTDRRATEAADQAAKFADTASAEIDAATDAASAIKAAKMTVEALNKLTEAIIASIDMSTTTDAREKFEASRFKTVRQLHTFIDPNSNDCQNVLDMLLQLDTKIKDLACHQRGEDDLFRCYVDESTQQCKCTRNSAGTCPNNKECILLADETCQCSKCQY